jgi:DNA segregation ATPase FtsK/SpoIIIE-like protein
VWVCSAPGYGKTNFLQLLLAAASLGTQVRLFIHDGKGEGDLEVYRDLADHFSQGSNDAAGRDCARMLAGVRDLRGTRAALIRRVRAERPDLMPGPQITREVTEDPRWSCPLIVVLVDEFNLMVKTSSGDDIQKETVGIAEGCRSGGIIPVIAGQNFRADVLDGAQASIGTRVAFKTATPEDSNTILGKGQVGEGFNTSKWPDNYQGVAIVRPAGRQVQSGTHQVKMHLGEYEDHVAIAARAKRLRPARTPQASEGSDLLTRVTDAVGGDNVVPVDELAERLGAVDVEALVADLRAARIPVEPSRQHGNRRAVRRRDLPAT